MAEQHFRLPDGGRIDHDKPVKFYFNGKTYYGYQGDTLASALLSNGVHLIGRSFKYHRPRGIYSCGPEEPNALVQTGNTPNYTDPNIRATMLEIYPGLRATSQNCWPSVRHDIGAFADWFSPLLSAGFYYKTFMHSPSWWHFFEKYIRRAAGMGISPQAFDPDRYDRQYAHTDILIIGSGPAGLTAAYTAAKTGAQVWLVDEQHELGGRLLDETPNHAMIHGQLADNWRENTIETLASYDNVTIKPRTTALGYYHEDFICLLERVSDHLPFKSRPEGLPRQKFWQLRARTVILATGAIERPLIFNGNDRPGVMLAQAGRAYVNRYAVKPGEEAVIVTNNDDAYKTALDFYDRGIKVNAIVDIRRKPQGELTQRATEASIPIYRGYSVVETRGRHRIKSVTIMPMDRNDQGVAGHTINLSCDVLLNSGGWNPAIHLFSHHLGTVTWDEDGETIIPNYSHQPIYNVGSAAGHKLTKDCINSAKKQTENALLAMGFTPTHSHLWEVQEPETSSIKCQWQLPSRKPLKQSKAFVDIQNDVTVKDIHLAVEEGYLDPEHVKRYTTTGMGTDQGKTSGINALVVIGDAQNTHHTYFKPTTYRPPYTPVPFGAIAGQHCGPTFFDANRYTPMHTWHQKQGAVFENVGQWWRPRYYPINGESMEEAVQRECKAARTQAAVLDGTTLGKIDIQGPDAPEFLNRVYTNGWKKLQVGRCRYGIMLGEDGMVMDDGVTARLAEDHYQMSTTTGGAAKVFAWLERWLQTEYYHMQVYLTSVTEQWAVISLCGPSSYEIVSQLTDDIETDLEVFRFMDVKDGHFKLDEHHHIPARIFRISFTGETTYEINVPSSYGLAAWHKVFEVGEPYGLTPYGTEGMHLLRAEKGFILVGQETDGTVTPHDLDMDWIVRYQKGHFIGKRSLCQSDLQREDRKQLVGLYTHDSNFVLEEGRHVIETQEIPDTPVPMLGHISSSYYSPNLERSIAFAIIRNGKQRMGETLYVVYPEKKQTIPVTVTNKEFL